MIVKGCKKISFGMICIRLSNLRLLELCCIKGTNESSLGKDSLTVGSGCVAMSA